MLWGSPIPRVRVLHPRCRCHRQAGNIGLSPQWRHPLGIFERSAAKTPQSKPPGTLLSGPSEKLIRDTERSCRSRRLIGVGASCRRRTTGGVAGKALNQQRLTRSPSYQDVPLGFILCILPNDGDHIIGGKTLVAQHTPSLRWTSLRLAPFCLSGPWHGNIAHSPASSPCGHLRGLDDLPLLNRRLSFSAHAEYSGPPAASPPTPSQPVGSALASGLPRLAFSPKRKRFRHAANEKSLLDAKRRTE